MRLRSWIAPGGPTEPIDLALRLTLIALLLRPMDPWFVGAFVLLLALLGLVGVGRRAPAAWLALAALIATRLVVEWPLPDNHVYLLGYWCLGVAIALKRSEPSRALATTGRQLLALAFVFAVLWKGVFSPDYRDGRFFAVTLLTDDRFADTVRLFGGLSEAQLAESREYLTPLPDGAELLAPPRLHAPSRFRWLVHGATWGGLALEAAIAILWLAPGRRRALVIARHGAVLLFCLATYAFAPVAGFGWVLLVMGLATTTFEERRLRAAYVAAFCLVLLYAEIPWASLVVAVATPG
jgi:hypothetical protein